MMDFYDKLSLRHPKQLFCRLNVRDNEELCYAAVIEYLPTFIYYMGGQEIDREVGTDKKRVENKLKKHKAELPDAGGGIGGV